MTKADKYMIDIIDRIRNEGYEDVNPRPKYADGTPAHTISVNHTFRTYDLSKILGILLDNALEAASKCGSSPTT